MSNVLQSASPKLIRRKTSGGGSSCAVPGCSNSSHKDKALGRKLSYSRFPLANPKRLKLWLSNIKRDFWTPKSSDRICSSHFVGGVISRKESDAAYIPTIFPACQTPPATEQPRHAARTPSLKRPATALRDPVTPATGVSLPSESPQPPKRARRQIIEAPVKPSQVLASPFPDTDQEDTVEDNPPNAMLMDHDYITTHRDQTPYSQEYIDLQMEVQRLRHENDQLKTKVLCIDSVKDNDEEFKYMTNMVNYSQFKCFAMYLHGRCGGNLKYWNGQQTEKHNNFALKGGKKPGRERLLTFEEEFFMVLVKLKRGLDNRELHLHFRISESTISRIFTTWINFLNGELTFLMELPPVDLSSVKTVPCFDDFPDVQIVLDCTELFTQRSSDLQARKETFSNYKHHDTVKFLVGLSPYQSVNFVSSAWGGRATDKHITLNSEDLLNNLAPGSHVMADRGFLVTEELCDLGVKLIMPHFKGRDRPQFSAKESTSSAKISTARVHIERAIQRIKTFHILEKSIRMNQKDLIEQMFRVCAYLSNFQAPIVKC